MRNLLLLLYCFLLFSCADDKDTSVKEQKAEKTPGTSSNEMEFKVLDSRYLSKDSLWINFNKELDDFGKKRYKAIKSFLLEKNIPQLQTTIASNKISYEEVALFYLYRIRKWDRENKLSLNSVIAINPDLLKEARQKDAERNSAKHPIFGIPVLLKDNIDTQTMATTAGAAALQDNQTSSNAFIVKKLKENGALILGKANLSEWAYFFCEDCPSGYSAIGGQTLNPYGRKIFDTGGSSSGSAVAVAANLAPVAVGTETAGSILSPSSQNAVVGLKPTVGLLSRRGIIPISSTLDTPGPITRTVVDNAILLSAMGGKDSQDPATKNNPKVISNYYSALKNSSLANKRFGAIKSLLKDSLYAQAIEDFKNAGAEIVEFEAPSLDLPNFTRLLDLDMKKDLPAYFENYARAAKFRKVQDVIDFNAKDSMKRAPYGQELFKGVAKDSASKAEFAAIKDTLQRNGKQFFNLPMQENGLDGILSINNYHAGYAAVALYPGITIPMGYTQKGKPEGLTIFAKAYQEQQLLEWAKAYEMASKKRQAPKNYN